MVLKPLRWLTRNLSTLILAFIISLVVWISAVVTTNPNLEKTITVPIDLVGQDPKLLIIGEIPSQSRLTLNAPQSIWNQIDSNPSLTRAWVDLAGLGPGDYTLEVKTSVAINPVRYTAIDPQEIVVTLEPLKTQSFPVQLIVIGEPPVGYKKGLSNRDPAEVTVSGPESEVLKIAQVNATLDIAGATETIVTTIPVELVDELGNTVSNVSVTPKLISVTQSISLLGGFKNVVVKVVTTGQVANGYRLTNVSVSPPTVTVFSEDPRLVDNLPGFIDTVPVDLTNLNDDIEINVGLNLPVGITSVREPVVLVQVSVAAIEGSLTLSLPVEIIGLSPELDATISPATVEVIIAGPLNLLETLTPEDFRVVLDLSGLPPGIYQRPPSVDQFPELVRIQTTIPETVEVNLVLAPTPTPTEMLLITPGTTLTVTITPTVTPQP